MSRWPDRLRKQVIDDVQATWSDQVERLVDVVELAWPGVGEDEVVVALPVILSREPIDGISDDPSAMS